MHVANAAAAMNAQPKNSHKTLEGEHFLASFESEYNIEPEATTR